MQPFWSPDGSAVRFIDRPSSTEPSGIWEVGLAGGEPQFVTDRLGFASPDGSLIAYPEGGQTYIEEAAGGERWAAPSSGRAISFSPDGALIAWQVASSTVNFDRRLVEVWVANVDGSQPHMVAELTGGGLSGWFPDGRRVLVSGRDLEAQEGFLAELNLADGGLREIVRGERLRGGSLSPEGGWIAYQISFSRDPEQDGLWVVRTDGTDARQLDIFGSYRWRLEGRLVMIPLEPGAPSHRVLEIDAATGEARPLTDPAVTPFRIAGGDWSLSPDGNRIAFVSAEDRNIWVIELGD